MEDLGLVDDAWANFIDEGYQTIDLCSKKKDDLSNEIPKPNQIYISTKTKIAFLNIPIPLKDIFWKIPTIKYQERKNGIIKKQMKVNCTTKEELKELDKQIEKEEMIYVDIISKIDNPNARKIKFKDVRKINIGLCKKDLTCVRKKKKGAFYNCFVVILRIMFKQQFKEVHIKVFNTGKLEIPGIQDDSLLYLALDELIKKLQPFIEQPLSYDKEKIDTVLINSNFTCNFYIDRNKLFNILKYKYRIHTMYDPCSYPGIQCKFYYNEQSKDGVCKCPDRCNKKGKGKGKNNCLEVSFMIFRTGSILIVGNCEEFIINIIYNYIVNLLKTEYHDIHINGGMPINEKIKKKKKVRKRGILISKNPVN